MGRYGEEAKNKIFLAAIKCFAENGYFGTSLSRIAKEAGVSKSLILWYYPSKDSLVVEVAIKSLPLDVINECLRNEKLRGRAVLECVVSNYIKKYGDEVMRKLLFHTLALKGLYEPVSRSMNILCDQALTQLAEKAYGNVDPESLVKVRALIGGLICYTLNPMKDMELKTFGKYLLEILSP